MSNKQDILMDTILQATIFEMVEDWPEVELNAKNIHSFAEGKFSFVVSLKNIEKAIKRRLICNFQLFDLKSLEEGADNPNHVQECVEVLNMILQDEKAEERITTLESFNKLPFMSYRYKTLLTMNKELIQYGAEDLLVAKLEAE